MANKKKLRSLAAAFCFLASTALADDIRIAIAGPFTGPQAASGADMRAGALAAQDVINANGGINGKRLVLQFEDDACSPRDAVSVANRVIGNNISMLYGHFCSPATLAAMNTYRENEIAQLTLSQADQITTARHPGLFRINVSNAQLAGKLAQETMTAATRVGVIYDHTAYGRGMVDSLAPHFKAAGVTPTLYGFNPDDRDFSAIATSILAARIDTLLVAGSADQIGIIIRQLRGHAYDGRFFTPGTGTLPDVGQLAYCSAANTTAIGVGVRQDVLENRPDIQAAFKRQNVLPRDTVMISYAAIETLAEAARRADSVKPRDITNQLNLGNFSTLMGILTWDLNGDLQTAPIRGYRWVCEQGRAVLRSLPQ